ncbi:sugar ABC transporter ATP-binding protein [Rhodococcus koreensis]
MEFASTRTATSQPGQTVAPVIRLVDVEKRFGGVTVLKKISFDVMPGEVHALVGENGAGKSTLMKVLHGIYQPDGGHIDIDGQSVVISNPRTAESLGIALVPQELELFPDLSVVENLFVNRTRPRHKRALIDSGVMHERAEKVFDALGERIDLRMPVRYLSVAEQQMVMIGRALLEDARVIVFDEPTASLSEPEVRRLFRIMKSLRESGVGLVYISHRLAEIDELADRITVIRDGTHVVTSQAGDLTRHDLVRHMVGRPLTQLFSRQDCNPGEVLLQATGLTRTGEFSEIDLQLRAGEVVGLSGLVGSGRTEVAETLFGLRAPASGVIEVRGEVRAIRSADAAQSMGIALVPEERRTQALLLSESIRRNIGLGALSRLTRFGIVNRRKEAELADELTESLGVRRATVAAPVGRLSGGNQQKVVLAKALANEPSVLILDEPTRGVDIGAKQEIYRLIDELANNGSAILMISSELDEVLAMSDRVVVMREGIIAAEFDRESATRESLMSAAAGVAAGTDSSQVELRSAQ